jgi:hypothetical protein
MCLDFRHLQTVLGSISAGFALSDSSCSEGYYADTCNEILKQRKSICILQNTYLKNLYFLDLRKLFLSFSPISARYSLYLHVDRKNASASFVPQHYGYRHNGLHRYN